MDQSLIAQKLRELADLFEEQAPQTQPKAVKATRSVPTEPEIVKATRPVPTEPEKQIELDIESTSKIELAADNNVGASLDDLRQGMAELIGSGKRDKVVAILAKLGVKKVSDIAEDKFTDAMDLINGAR